MEKVSRLCFESRLAASPEVVWQWITSASGISAEMRPWLRMNMPGHISSLSDIDFIPGERLFRSRFLLLGLLPVDSSDLTLLELKSGEGFVEQSPMGSIRSWRHVRRIESEGEGRAGLVDELSFEPRMATALSTWVVRQFFRHRHRVLKRHFAPA